MMNHLWCNGSLMTIIVAYLYTIRIISFAVTPAVRIKRRVAHIEILRIQPILHQSEGFAEPLEVHDLALS